MIVAAKFLAIFQFKTTAESEWPRTYQFSNLNPGSCFSSLDLLSRLKSSVAMNI
jgi:hypothetical protein